MSDEPGRWTYKHLKPDSAGYIECFRILREAKKDGVICGWQMNSGHGYDHKKYVTDYNVPAVIGFYGPASDGQNDIVFAEDGTKGDIGLLREAADYVLELKHQKWLESQPIHAFDGMDIKEAFRVLNEFLKKTGELKNTKQPKSVSEMNTEAIYQEILNSGYRIETIFESGCWPSLCMVLKGTWGHSTQQQTTETLRDFYERCLEYARSDRP